MALTLTLVQGTDSTAYAYDKALNSALSQATFELNLGAYATDGVALAPSDITAGINGSCTSIKSVIFHGPSPDGVHWASHNPTTGKVLSWASSGTQTANGVDLSTAAKKLHCTILFS